MNLCKSTKVRILRNNNIEQIKITKLSEIKTNNGNVMHIMKKNDETFKSFGEAYFSWIEQNTIKGWKKHKRMTMNLVVPIGSVKFVFFDPSLLKSKVITIGEDYYSRITVPPDLWFGFKGIGNCSSLVLNIGSILHDSKEVERLSLDKIDYNWD